MLEYEKFQEMQSKMMKMQEEYDLKLAEKEESKMKDMERQTEYYETKLREKISQLEQVCRSITRPKQWQKILETTFFVLSLPNVICKFMMRGETLLILGCGLKGQVNFCTLPP